MTSTPAERVFMPTVSDQLPDGERPMIAIVRALPRHEEALADATATLAAAVRREPGCKEFRAFRDADHPGIFYLYEIYADLRAFREHLITDHVAAFFGELEAHSTSDAGALTQLIELPVR